MDIIATSVVKRANINLSPGQHIKILVTSSDGTIVSTVMDDTCPASLTFSGTVSYSGNLNP